MRACLLLISFLLALWCVAGDVNRYDFELSGNQGEISGILVTADDGNVVKGSVINQFGLTAVDFGYNKLNQKVRLYHLVGFLNKWKIKYVLKRDLKAMMQVLYGRDVERLPSRYKVTRDGNCMKLVNTRFGLNYIIKGQ